MALLAAPTTSGVVLQQQRPNVISALGPVVNGALQFQQLLSSTAFHLFIRTYFAASIIAAASLLASRSLVWATLFTSRALITRGTVLTGRLAGAVWESKRVRRVRKKLEYELFALLFSPGGNALFLMLFWPGWLMLGGALWGLRLLVG